jgi:hypothetical protein
MVFSQLFCMELLWLRGFVADEIAVAFVGVEAHDNAAHVAPGIGGAAPAMELISF